MTRGDATALLRGPTAGRLSFAAILILMLVVVAGLGATDAAAAKKKKPKAVGVFKQTKAVNAAVPQVPATGPSTPVVSTLTVPKKFKGKVVGDLNVTGIQATGNGAGSVDDLSLSLTAPSGRTMLLINSGIGDAAFGPLTLDDDSRVVICDAPDTTSCEDPAMSLVEPFAGTANVQFLGGGDTGPLNVFNGLNMRGTWTLRVWDESGAATTSTFNSWGLQITPASPIAQTKKKAKAFQGSTSPNANVPDDAASGPSTPVTSTLTLGGKFKGKLVGDLNLTGLQTTGSAAGAADDLGIRVIAPNGRSVMITSTFGGDGLTGTSIGPLTIDDESPTSICDGPTTTNCTNPAQTLVEPFAGTANLYEFGTGGTGPLSSFDGVGMKGTWTLQVWDESSVGQTSVLNFWGLKITPAKPVQG